MANINEGLIEETTPCLKNKRVNMKLSPNLSNRNYLLDFLVILFGIASWVGVNGIYVQLPLLVSAAPEGWNLPSYMAVIIQLANIGPILYSILRKYLKTNYDNFYIYIILIVGVSATMLMAFFYDVTTVIGGESRSTVFLVMVFFVGLVGCTSSVLFFPYMRNYREVYLITYFIGEGFSGFAPSILALIQGVGGNPECILITDSNGNTTTQLIPADPRFNTRIFLICISLLIMFSFIAFTMMNNFKRFNSEKVEADSKRQNNSKNDVPHEENDSKDTGTSLLNMRYVILFILMAIVCAIGNGMIPSIQSYSCLPYGNLAYHLAVTLGAMANPVACFIALFLPQTSSKSIAFLSMSMTVVISYVLATSLLSPSPPLVGTTIGVVLVVLAWIFAVGLVSYIKLSISTVFRSLGGTAMFYCGAVSQLGSAVGSLLFFFLVNYASLFHGSDPCANVHMT